MKALTGDRHTRRDRRNDKKNSPATEATFGLPESIKPFAPKDLNSPVTAIPFRSLKTGRGEITLIGYDASTSGRAALLL